jgi:hypothetical protein
LAHLHEQGVNFILASKILSTDFNNAMKNTFYTLLIIGLILLIWFAPIDLDRERALANSGPRKLIVFVLETTWVKVIATVFLGLVAIGLQAEEKEKRS